MTHDDTSFDAIFCGAIEIASTEERAAFIARACGPDEELRRRVEGLVAAHFQAGSFLETPPASPTASMAPAAPVEETSTVIGPYKLLQPIGEGGMGTVYMAEQTRPVRRKVALKVIKAGMGSRQVVARFEAERQALAMMDHVNIARVLDAGATDSGRPYFVMELVHGVPITRYCDDNRLSPRERLELFVPVCQAIQHAHQKGIIHRDVKPSNVLVTLYDGRPVPKVIDFGVAKAIEQTLTERTMFTQYGTLVGTLEYMSPEQAEMSALGVDTRSDVYSLGVLLYELLTGSTPLGRERIREAAFGEVLRMIKEDEPARPSTRLSGSSEALASISAQRHTEPAKLMRLVRGELDWIVMKSLEKDRNRRYEAASALAADVQRHLDGEVVEASPPSATYRARKFARKHRAALAMAATVAAILVVGIATSTWLAIRARSAEQATRLGAERTRKERDRAVAAERVARAEAEKSAAVNDFLTHDILIQAEPENNAAEDQVTLLEVLDRAAGKVGERFGDHPEVEAALRGTIARTYHGLGSFAKADRQIRAQLEVERRLRGGESAGAMVALGELGHYRTHLGKPSEAIELLRRAVDGLVRILGPDHLNTLSCRNKLGAAYRDAGRTTEAIATHEATLKLYEARHGAHHPDALFSRSNLALTYFDAGRITEAIALDEETLKQRQSLRGAGHPETLVSRNNLAAAHGAAGRAVESIAIYEETLRLSEARLGDVHPETLQCRNNLAVAYLAAGRQAEAVTLFEATLKARESSRGADHPETLASRDNLAVAYRQAGRADEAVAMHELTLKLRQSTRGADHPDTLTSRNNLAVAYRNAGRADEAIAMHEETLRLLEAKHGADHLDTIRCRGNLAAAYGAAGRVAEAVAMNETALRQFEAKLGAQDPRTLQCRNNLAAAYWSAGRQAEAVTMLEATLRDRESSRGADHPETLASRANLLTVYLAGGSWDRAAPLLRDRIERRRRGPADGPALAGDLEALGDALIRGDNPAEAEAPLRECLAIREQESADVWPRFHAMSLLGGALLGQEQFAAAEPLLIGGYEGLKARESTIPPQSKVRLSEAGERIVGLYDAWGQPEKAAEWRRMLATRTAGTIEEATGRP